MLKGGITGVVMISKKYRLKEREVKKVLKKWKPFFSYGIVLNYVKNKVVCNRFAIVIWAKSVLNNVQRNFFRRRFYDEIAKSALFSFENNEKQGYDFIFVVKKQTKLDKNNTEVLKKFKSDIKFLIDKIN